MKNILHREYFEHEDRHDKCLEPAFTGIGNEKADDIWWRRILAIALVIICVALTLRVIPYSQDVSTGTEVSVIDKWESVLHFAYGHEASFRRETYADGRIMFGPIKDGKRHGTWTLKTDERKTFKSFRIGKPL